MSERLRGRGRGGGVMRGTAVKCLARDIKVPGSSLTRFTDFFFQASLGKTLQSPSLAMVKPTKYMNISAVALIMTEVMLKAA